MIELLVVDDEPSIREYLSLLFASDGYRVHVASTVQEATRVLLETPTDVVLTDLRLGRASGLDVLKAARALSSPPEVIVVTAFGTPATAVDAMRRGAYDYITKPFDNDELKLLVERAAEKRGLRVENTRLHDSTNASTFVGPSPAMTAVWDMVRRVVATRSTVLLTGESGTGKEIVARALHQGGSRARSPFVAVNCAALAEGVLESELFGHLRGAFTGASADREGLLVTARDGTVLLDEIGEMPLGLQAKLLRVLQERKVKPVGSSRESPFDARILAATNRKLELEVKAGRFREDLLFRLNVITIELPPLRSRSEDIPGLAAFFLRQIASELGRPRLSFTPEALQALSRYAFPGNVRQMRNIVERAATLSDGDELGLEALPAVVRAPEAALPETTELAIPENFSLEDHLDGLERRFLLEALARSGGVKVRAAELLGLSFRSFRYRLAKLGIAADD